MYRYTNEGKLIIQIKAQLFKENKSFHLTCQVKSIASVAWHAMVRKSEAEFRLDEKIWKDGSVTSSMGLIWRYNRTSIHFKKC